MRVMLDGHEVGEIALVGRGECSVPDAKHGYLLYAFFHAGSETPEGICCDEHAHDGDGLWQGILKRAGS